MAALEITKRRYVDYLDAVGERMLPWLRDRPLSLVRAPDGVDGRAVLPEGHAEVRAVVDPDRHDPGRQA